MLASEFREKTEPLLRPTQVAETEEEKRRVTEILSAPPHIAAQVQDRGELVKQARRLGEILEKGTPRPYSAKELDAAVKRERVLRSFWTEGMPTQAEMRKNPVGAVDKHRRWERAKKKAIQEWKNIKLRLHATEAMVGADSHLSDERDVANIEHYRPRGGSGELNMDVAQIVRPSYSPLPDRPVPVFTDQEIGTLRQVDPELAGQLALLSAEARAQVKAVLAQFLASQQTQAEQEPPPPPPPASDDVSAAELDEILNPAQQSLVSTAEIERLPWFEKQAVLHRLTGRRPKNKDEAAELIAKLAALPPS